MISNYILRTRIDNLKSQRDELVKKKLELSETIKEFGVSKTAAWRHETGKSHKLDPAVIENRKVISGELIKVDGQLTEIKAELRDLYRQGESEQNRMLITIFGELFTKEQMLAIRLECERRIAGDHPFKLDFNINEGIKAKVDLKTCRALAKSQLEKMIEFRIVLTGLIEKGCEKFGDGEFLKFISPLNNLIIPVKELEKIRREY